MDEICQVARKALREEVYKRKQEEVAFQVVRTCLQIYTAKEYIGSSEDGIEEARKQRIAEIRYHNSVNSC
jgi:predicted metallo-beta-lactamase superfamily hydrolase